MFGVPKVRINSFLKAGGFRKRMIKFFKNLFSDIKVLPYESRTLVVTHSHEDVFYKIYNSLKPHEQVLIDSRESANYRFNGTVSMSSFRISMRLKASNSFIPELRGEIEPTRNGCLIFIKYRLMPSSAFFLLFMLCFFGAVSGFLFWAKQDYLASFMVFVSLISTYGVALLNFNRLVKVSHKTFIEIMS
jgi:hypothetical protein